MCASILNWSYCHKYSVHIFKALLNQILTSGIYVRTAVQSVLFQGVAPESFQSASVKGTTEDAMI
jgi:hypothetical protein